MQTIKVSQSSNVNSLAGSIALTLNEYGRVNVQVIGAKAVNQAVKGIATCRGYLAPQGNDLICTPSYMDLQLEQGERTAIVFYVKLIKKGE